MNHKRKHTVIPPRDGWEPETLYLVEVAMRDTNPVHRSLFYSGFLNDGEPSGYNRVINPISPQDSEGIHNVRYLKVVKKLCSGADLRYLGRLLVLDGELKRLTSGDLPHDAEARDAHECPQYVKLAEGGAALCYDRRNRHYYRTAGGWSIDYYRFKTNDGYSYRASPLCKNTAHLYNIELIPITKAEHDADNNITGEEDHD